MGSLYPAFKAKFGSLEYFITHMPVSDIVSRVKFPYEMPEWKKMSIEEMYQRRINFNRVKKGIAQYFACDPNRFSGAIVLAMLNHDSIKFDPLEKLKDVLGFYETASSSMGYLTLSGKEVLVPIDGQHRVKAFDFAMSGTDEKDNPIPDMKPNLKIGSDSVAVILIRFDGNTARRIFSKINRYAKSTNREDNLITDDDDPMSVITRKLLDGDGIIPSGLVRIYGRTLSGSAPQFTTLSTFYDATVEIFNGLCVSGAGTIKDMTEEQVEVHTKDIRKEWEGLLSNVDLWREAIADPSEAGDATRVRIRKETLLGKPIGQSVLVAAYSLVRQRDKMIDAKSIYARINAIDWDVGNKDWEDVLMHSSGKVMFGKTVKTTAAEVIAYMLGSKLSRKDKARLLENIYGSGTRKKFPKRVVNV